MSTIEEFRAEKAKQSKAAKDAATLFVAALESGEPALLAESLEKLAYNESGWSRALRVAAKLKEVHPKSRLMMVRLLVDSGDAIRDHVDNDLLLCDALRNIVPPYQGDAVVLYRGESALARQRRVYGLSWSSDRCVADSFARNHGGVVLEKLLRHPRPSFAFGRCVSMICPMILKPNIWLIAGGLVLSM